MITQPKWEEDYIVLAHIEVWINGKRTISKKGSAKTVGYTLNWRTPAALESVDLDKLMTLPEALVYLGTRMQLENQP